jgi:hypothetical protein
VSIVICENVEDFIAISPPAPVILQSVVFEDNPVDYVFTPYKVAVALLSTKVFTEVPLLNIFKIVPVTLQSQRPLVPHIQSIPASPESFVN